MIVKRENAQGGIKQIIIIIIILDDIKLLAKNEKELETLIQTVRIYTQDIGMGFCIEKCSMLVLKSGKGHTTEGVELPNQVVIRTLGEK